MHRHNARRKTVQALYQFSLTKSPLDEIEKQFLTSEDFKKVDREYFQQLFRGAYLRHETWDGLFEKYLVTRSLLDLDPIELSVLRMATYELSECLEVPYRVVINEAVELTKIFGATDSYKFVNGVLDQLARDLRSIEVEHHAR
jgi:N utilization substance protein B